MRHTIAILLVFISSAAFGQDIQFMLAGAKMKKWIGANTYAASKEENETYLTFYSNFTLQEYSVTYKKPSVPQHWKIISGEFIKDADIIIEIGKREYNVEFSRTSNGRDFMTITRIPLREDELPVMKTYYAE